MNADEAIKEIIHDARSERMSYTSFKRVCRALKALGLDGGQQARSLAHLGYVRHDTLVPYVWLAATMALKKRRSG